MGAGPPSPSGRHRGHWTLYVSTNVSGIWERGAHGACSLAEALSVVDETLSRLTDRQFPPGRAEPSVEPEEGDKPPGRFFRSLAYLSRGVARRIFHGRRAQIGRCSRIRQAGEGRSRGQMVFPISYPGSPSAPTGLLFDDFFSFLLVKVPP